LHVKLIDYIKYTDTFSKSTGLTHEQLRGHVFLLEFDPTFPYEKTIENFVKEAFAHFESVSVFTRKGSAIYTSLANYPVKLFLLSKSPNPQASHGNETYLPANNADLILDSINTLLETCTYANLCLIFDNLSELFLSIGVEKSFNFAKYTIEMLYSKRITALFLLNPGAHDPMVVSLFRGLFSNQARCIKEGVELVKLEKGEGA